MANTLILGATSAVATELAHRFARQGDRLFLVGRNTDKLSKIAPSVEQAVAGTLSVDFNDTSKAGDVINEAVSALGNLDKVIIAHGYIGDQLQSETDFDHAFDIIHSNYVNCVALLIPLVKQLKQQGYGKIGVLLTVAGDRGRPRNFTYGSAKGALALYLQGLRSTLYGSDIAIYSFKLGPVDSPMTVDHEKNFSFSTISHVAEIIEHSLEKKRYTRYVPGYWFFVMWAVRWMPEFIFQRLKFLSGR